MENRQPIIEQAKAMTAADHIEAASVLLAYDVQAANADKRIAKAHVHALLAIAMK